MLNYFGMRVQQLLSFGVWVSGCSLYCSSGSVCTIPPEHALITPLRGSWLLAIDFPFVDSGFVIMLRGHKNVSTDRYLLTGKESSHLL